MTDDKPEKTNDDWETQDGVTYHEIRCGLVWLRTEHRVAKSELYWACTESGDTMDEADSERMLELNTQMRTACDRVEETLAALEKFEHDYELCLREIPELPSVEGRPGPKCQECLGRGAAHHTTTKKCHVCHGAGCTGVLFARTREM